MSLLYTPDYQWVKVFMLELEQQRNPAYKEAIAEKFKLDMSDALGIPAPQIRTIAAKYQPDFNRLSAARQVALCDRLLEEGIYEYRISCFQWLRAQKKHWSAGHLPVFERWLRNHITGWPDCDDFCSSVLGGFFLRFPNLTGACLSWSASPNPMVRRAGLVALIKPAKKAGRLYPALMQCDASLHDEDVLVQKALSWLLKETSKVFPDEVLQWLKSRCGEIHPVAFGPALKNLPAEAQQEIRKLRKQTFCRA